MAGLGLGYAGFSPWGMAGENPGKYALYLLMLLVGISIGADSRSLQLLKSQGSKLLLIPLATILGTLIGVLPVAALFYDLSAGEALAIGAGFGYYSLSSIIISQLHSETLGVVALLSNVIREIITLVAAPAMVLIFGPLSPVSAAGATSMDTTLPVIITASGKDFAIIALFHGMVLTILVPLLVPLILAWLV